MGIADFLQRVLQIVLIDIALSADNVAVIALAVRRLPARHARLARLTGVTGALTLRARLVLLRSFLLSVPWRRLRRFGGILLLCITVGLLREKPERRASRPDEALDGGPEVPQRGAFGRAVAAIIAADAGMSFDNVLAVSSVVLAGTSGSIGLREVLLLAFGLLLCVPLLLVGSTLAGGLLRRFPAVLCVCAGVLVHAALGLLFEDPLFAFLLRYSTWVSASLGVAVADLSYILKRSRVVVVRSARR